MHAARRRPRRAGDRLRRAAAATPLVFRAGGTSLNGQGADRRHPRRRPPPLARDRGARRRRAASGSARDACSAHVNRVLAPLRPQARPRPRLDRHRHRRRRDRQQLGRDALRRRRRLLRDGARADLRAAVRNGDRHRRRRAPSERFAAAEPELAAGLAADPRRDPLRRGAARADPPQVRDQEHDRLPALRVPRRRRAARDLPPPAGRLRGDARLHRRGRLRDRAASRR